MSDTIAAVSTGTQVCAIGIVRLSGSAAIDIADKLFAPMSGAKMSAAPTAGSATADFRTPRKASRHLPVHRQPRT